MSATLLVNSEHIQLLYNVCNLSVSWLFSLLWVDVTWYTILSVVFPDDIYYLTPFFLKIEKYLSLFVHTTTTSSPNQVQSKAQSIYDHDTFPLLCFFLKFWSKSERETQSCIFTLKNSMSMWQWCTIKPIIWHLVQLRVLDMWFRCGTFWLYVCSESDKQIKQIHLDCTIYKASYWRFCFTKKWFMFHFLSSFI